VPDTGHTNYPLTDSVALPSSPGTTKQNATGDGTVTVFQLFEILTGFIESIRNDLVVVHKPNVDAHHAKMHEIGSSAEHTFTADLDMGVHKVLSSAVPSGGSDLVNKTYADALIAAADAMVFKGVIDCSANPNYPAADRGWTYRVSVAGKIGGASGPNVEVGDLLLCLTDGTASGTQAAVGANWEIAQANIDGAVTGPAASTDNAVALFNGTTGKVVKDSGVILGSLASKSTVASADITDGTIVNADVNAAAAIARSKLDFGTGLVNADIAAAAAIAYTKLALTGSIVAADIAAAAAIPASKLAVSAPFIRAPGYYHRAWPSNSLTTGLETTNRLIAYRMPLGNAVTISRIGLEVTTIGDAGRSVADMVTNGTTTITSATAAFVSTDQGRLVTGTNIPNNTFIQSVTNGTTAVLSQAATGSGSGGTLNISGAIYRLGIFADNAGLPGALLLDTGISGTANNGGAAMFVNAGAIDGRTAAVQEITVNLALAAGDYWVGYVAQGVTSVAPTSRVLNIASGMAIPLWAAMPTANLVNMACQQTAVVVALPNPMVTGSFVNNPASIFFKC
jgi:hypothetical protein